MTMVLRPGETVDDLVPEGNGACPRCRGALRRWGTARSRQVRGFDHGVAFRPPRVRCGSCGVTHVVLPADVLLRRRDATVVIGRALRAAAGGAGARRVAAMVGVPMETVRGWLRRARAGVQAGADRSTRAMGSALQRAVTAWDAAAGAAGCTEERDIWHFTAHRTQGRLLSNTS